MAMVTSLVSVILPAILPMSDRTDEELANRMPGLPAFIVFVFLAIALFFLLKNMNARLRRMSYREKEREALEAQREAEQRERDESAGDGESGAAHTDPR